MRSRNEWVGQSVLCGLCTALCDRHTDLHMPASNKVQHTLRTVQQSWNYGGGMQYAVIGPKVVKQERIGSHHKQITLPCTIHSLSSEVNRCKSWLRHICTGLYQTLFNQSSNYHFQYGWPFPNCLDVANGRKTKRTSTGSTVWSVV